MEVAPRRLVGGSDLRRRLTNSAYYLLAFLVILYGYGKFIVPLFGYTGFEWDLNKFKVAEGTLVVFLISVFLPVRFFKPSDLLLHLQFLFPVLPMAVLYGAANEDRSYFYLTIFSFVIVAILASLLRLKPIRVSRVSPSLFARTLLILSWLAIGSIVLFGGLRYFNLDFSKVYDFREEAASHLPAIYGYLSPIVSKVLLPFSLLLSVLNKDRILAASSIIGSVVMFGLTSHKSVLFYPFVVLALYLILNHRDVVGMLVKGYVLVVVVSVLDFMVGGEWVGSLLLRRTYVVPAHINYLYHEYFSSHPLYLWSQSKLTFGLLAQHYSLGPANQIGLVYYHNAATSANTGWVGSGYANAGALGVFVYAILVGILFAVLNAFARTIDKKVVVAIATAPILAVLMSSDLPTAFLNHGVILTLFLFTLFSVKPVEGGRVSKAMSGNR